MCFLVILIVDDDELGMCISNLIYIPLFCLIHLSFPCFLFPYAYSFLTYGDVLCCYFHHKIQFVFWLEALPCQISQDLENENACTYHPPSYRNISYDSS